MHTRAYTHAEKDSSISLYETCNVTQILIIDANARCSYLESLADKDTRISQHVETIFVQYIYIYIV